MISVERISPSMALGFYCRTAEELDLFLDMARCTVRLSCSCLSPLPTAFALFSSSSSPDLDQIACEDPPLFTIMETRPNLESLEEHVVDF